MNPKAWFIRGLVFGIVLFVWTAGFQTLFVHWVDHLLNLPKIIAWLPSILGYTIAAWIGWGISKVV